jgi:hypothetical protein
MTASVGSPDETGVSDEAIALAGVLDGLKWRHVLEKDVEQDQGNW